MAQIDYLVSIQMNQNQLLLPVIHNATSAPVSPTPVEGQMYANTTSNTLWYYDGTTWIDLSVSTVPDADYGDITVSSTGTVWTINDEAVTLAKMAHIATDRFLGRTTAATGDVEVLTTAQATAMLDLFSTGSTTQGLVPGSNGGGASVFLDGSGAWSSPGGGFADFDAGADQGVDVTVNSGDLLEITSGVGTTVGSTPIETTISKASTTVTVDIDLDFIDDDTLATATATNIPSSESVKAYVDAAVTAGMTYKGGYNASTNTPALDTGSPVLEIGDTYYVTVAGTFFTEAVEVGDALIANVDSSDAAALADWTILQTNIDYATDSVPGFVRLATQALVNTGTNTTDVVTADTLEDKTMGTYTGSTITDNVVLKTVLQELETAVEANAIVNASETVKGVVEEATDAETAAGTATGATGAKLFVTPAKLQTELGTTGADGSVVRRFTDTCDADTSTTVTHNFGTRDVIVQVYRTGTPWDRVVAEVKMTTTNTVDVNFNTAPTLAEYTIVVIG